MCVHPYFFLAASDRSESEEGMPRLARVCNVCVRALVRAWIQLGAREPPPRPVHGARDVTRACHERQQQPPPPGSGDWLLLLIISLLRKGKGQ